MVKNRLQCRKFGFHLWVGRSPGGGNGYTLQYSCLENPLDRAAWQATVHRVAESDMTEHPHTMKVIGDPHTAFEEGHILLGLK